MVLVHAPFSFEVPREVLLVIPPLDLVDLVYPSSPASVSSFEEGMALVLVVVSRASDDLRICHVMTEKILLLDG